MSDLGMLDDIEEEVEDEVEDEVEEEEVVDDDDDDDDDDEDDSSSDDDDASESSATSDDEDSSEEEDGDTAIASSSSSAASAAAAAAASASKINKRKRIVETDDDDDDEEEDDADADPHDPPAEQNGAGASVIQPIGYFYYRVDETTTIRLVALHKNDCPKTKKKFLTRGPIKNTYLYALPGDVAVFMGHKQLAPNTDLRFAKNPDYFESRAKAKTGTRAHGLMVMPPKAIVFGLEDVHKSADTDKYKNFLAKLDDADNLVPIGPADMQNYGAPRIPRGPNKRTTGGQKGKNATDVSVDTDESMEPPFSKKMRVGEFTQTVGAYLIQAVVRDAFRMTLADGNAIPELRELIREEIRTYGATGDDTSGKTGGKEEEEEED